MKLNLFIKFLTIAHFSTCELIRKMRMRIVLDDYESDYDILPRKRGKVIMKIKRLGVLAYEIFKTVNNHNYMKDIFTPKLHPQVRPNGILFKHHNTYGTKRIHTVQKEYGVKRIKH